MKTFEIEVKRTQFMTITVKAESIREAIDKAENPNESNWLPWEELETATYDTTHIYEIPNDDSKKN